VAARIGRILLGEPENKEEKIISYIPDVITTVFQTVRYNDETISPDIRSVDMVKKKNKWRMDHMYEDNQLMKI
jgi:hypothetical protein